MSSSFSDDPRYPLRQFIYGLLIMTSAVASAGRIFTVESSSGRTPFLSANDRSRWSTIRAIVDHGTYALDEVIFSAPGKRDKDWYSIDLVYHTGADGRDHYYSSKPPLLATLMAGEYWLVKQVTGATLAANPFYVGRVMLVLTNVVPWALALLLLSRVVEQAGASDWGRVFAMVVATWGTYLTTMSVTLNNHLPAAIGAVLAIYGWWRIERDESTSKWFYAIAGFGAAWCAANELPALCLFVLLTILLFRKCWRNTSLVFLPSAFVVAAAALGTTYLAHHSWRPPYAHRSYSTGAVVASIVSPTKDGSREETLSKTVPEALAKANIRVSSQTSVTVDERFGFLFLDAETGLRFVVRQTSVGYDICQWDHWYDYPGSYWTSGKKTGVDKGEESRAAYAFHALLGHHGVFSLTPVWLLTVVGIAVSLVRRDELWRLSAVVAMTAVICCVFYVLRPLEDRNYGGVSCGFRWLFWMIPLWLVTMLPAADAVGTTRIGRYVAVVLAAVGVFSATYNAMNPWSHPWLFDYWTQLGWLAY